MIFSDKIALIYFSRSTKGEADQKTFALQSTKRQRLSIVNFLNRKTLETLRETRLDILYFNEHNQVGRTFGEKISHAFESAFSQGYTAAISVGNDCLDLHTIDFQSISKSLLNEKCVLGPTYRKGAYLIALTKDAFNKKAFSALNWQTSDLASDLLLYFSSRKADIVVLETLRDVNTTSDITKLLASFNYPASLIRQLSNFVSFFVSTTNFALTFMFRKDQVIYTSLRAPPTAF